MGYSLASLIQPRVTFKGWGWGRILDLARCLFFLQSKGLLRYSIACVTPIVPRDLQTVPILQSCVVLALLCAVNREIGLALINAGQDTFDIPNDLGTERTFKQFFECSPSCQKHDQPADSSSHVTASIAQGSQASVWSKRNELLG